MRIIQEIGIGLVVHLLDSLTHRHRRRAKIGPVARARGRRLEPLLHIEIERAARYSANQARSEPVALPSQGRAAYRLRRSSPSKPISSFEYRARWACGRDAGNSLNPSRIISDRCWIVAHPNQLLHVLHPMGPCSCVARFGRVSLLSALGFIQGSVLGSDGRIASTSRYSCSSSRKWRT